MLIDVDLFKTPVSCNEIPLLPELCPFNLFCLLYFIWI